MGEAERRGGGRERGGWDGLLGMAPVIGSRGHAPPGRTNPQSTPPGAAGASRMLADLEAALRGDTPAARQSTRERPPADSPSPRRRRVDAGGWTTPPHQPGGAASSGDQDRSASEEESAPMPPFQARAQDAVFASAGGHTQGPGAGADWVQRELDAVAAETATDADKARRDEEKHQLHLRQDRDRERLRLTGLCRGAQPAAPPVRMLAPADDDPPCPLCPLEAAGGGAYAAFIELHDTARHDMAPAALWHHLADYYHQQFVVPLLAIEGGAFADIMGKVLPSVSRHRGGTETAPSRLRDVAPAECRRHFVWCRDDDWWAARNNLRILRTAVETVESGGLYQELSRSRRRRGAANARGSPDRVSCSLVAHQAELLLKLLRAEQQQMRVTQALHAAGAPGAVPGRSGRGAAPGAAKGDGGSARGVRTRANRTLDQL